jgi:hypothetical protein
MALEFPIRHARQHGHGLAGRDEGVDEVRAAAIFGHRLDDGRVHGDLYDVVNAAVEHGVKGRVKIMVQCAFEQGST